MVRKLARHVGGTMMLDKYTLTHTQTHTSQRKGGKKRKRNGGKDERKMLPLTNTK